MLSQEISIDADLSKYKGQWVIILDHKVVTSASNFTVIKNKLKSLKGDPVVFKVPLADTNIF